MAELLNSSLMGKLIEFFLPAAMMLYLTVRIDNRMEKLEDSLLAMLKDCLAHQEGEDKPPDPPQ